MTSPRRKEIKFKRWSIENDSDAFLRWWFRREFSKFIPGGISGVTVRRKHEDAEEARENSHPSHLENLQEANTHVHNDAGETRGILEQEKKA